MNKWHLIKYGSETRAGGSGTVGAKEVTVMLLPSQHTLPPTILLPSNPGKAMGKQAAHGATLDCNQMWKYGERWETGRGEAVRPGAGPTGPGCSSDPSCTLTVSECLSRGLDYKNVDKDSTYLKGLVRELNDILQM